MTIGTYTFTAPPAAAVVNVPTLSAGGVLQASTPYYYVVVPVGVGTDLASVDITYGPISNEVTKTTTSVNKTINLSWAAVAGAVGYIVFRANVSGTYGASTRIWDSATNIATTTGTSFADNGYGRAGHVGGGIAAPYCLTLLPASLSLPCGFNPRVNGVGRLEILGGTAGSPVTFADIGAWAIAAGYTNHFYWDGNTFGLLASLHNTPEASATYFKDVLAVWYQFGRVLLTSSHADSNFQFGSLSGIRGIQGCILYAMSNLYSYVYFGQKCKWYGGNILGSGDGRYGSAYASFLTSAVINYVHTEVEFKDARVMAPGGFLGTGINAALSNIFIPGRLLSDSSPRSLTYNWTTILDHLHATNQSCRIDRYTFGKDAGGAYQTYFLNAFDLNYIDCNFFLSTDANKLPIVYWPGSMASDKYVRVYQSFKLQVTDQNGAGLAGSLVTIKDSLGNIVTDYDGTAISGFLTDSSGRLWREAITITGATSITISDSSKSWTTDQFLGRNVWIIDGAGNWQQRKVLSNTGTQLTLTEAFDTTPAVGDHAGIILEILRARLNHKSGSGTGSGPTCTDTVTYTPHTVEIAASGYPGHADIFNINRPMDLAVVLVPAAGVASYIGLVPLGIKQVAL
jgi:hypothetical protein